MKSQKVHHRGTEMNKIQFSEIEEYLKEKGLNVNEAFEILADEKEFIYVSNGFLHGLEKHENEQGEWHHFFKKDLDGNFEAVKYYFN